MRKLIFTTLTLITFLCYSNAVTKTWYDSAQIRIDSIRKGNFTLKIVDKNGIGVQDSVKIKHKKHEFPWGTAIDLTYNLGTGNTFTSSQAVTAKSDSEVYITERWASYLAYLLPSVKGKKYKITIKLSENYFSSANSRLFDASVYGQKVIQNIDKYVLANGEFKAFDTTINVLATDTVIRLAFQATKDNASIMGLILADSTGNPILRLYCGGSPITTKSGNKYISDLAYIDKDAMATGTSNDDWLKAIMLKYCNYGVCGNQFKWSGIESTKGQLNYGPFENTLSWFQKVGWNMRAHNLLWGGTSSTDYHELPQWVGILAPKVMYDTCKMRVVREVSRYKGIVNEYDVLNEPTHATYLQSKVGDSINWNCFKWAHGADPDARLFVNDYNIIEYADQTTNFVNLVKKMIQNGAPVGGLGAQCHIGNSTDIVNFKSRFDQLARIGLPIKVTEFDMNAGSVSQQVQAIETSKMMRLCFSHPGIEGFIFWGLTDPGWATGVENLINVDRTPRIVADSVYHLIHEVWSTKLNAITDASGSYTFKGYFGDYDVLVKVGNTWKKYSVSFNKADQNNTVLLNEEAGKAMSPVLKKVRIKAPMGIELTFDKPMFDPSVDSKNYKVFDTLSNYVQSAALKTGDSTTIVLTMKSSIKAKGYIPVSYYPGHQTSSDGGILEPFGPVLDGTLTPAYLSSKTSVDGKSVNVAFNGKLADTSVNISNFVIKVNNKANNVTQANLSGKKDTLILTLANQILKSADAVTITYQPGSLQTTDSLFVTGFATKTVTNSIIVPTFVSALTSTDGTTIQVNFRQLIADPSSQSANFSVTVNSKSNQVTGALLLASNNKSVILSLNSTIKYGDTISVSYSPGSLVSTIGIPVPAFTSTVVNKTPVSVEIIANNIIELYPNPFTNQLMISKANNYQLVTITDLFGREISHLHLNSSGNTEINTSSWKQGMYLVILSNSKNQLVLKTVKE
jgi:uncharacterized repeat protein (TIGR02059 family)